MQAARTEGQKNANRGRIGQKQRLCLVGSLVSQTETRTHVPTPYLQLTFSDLVLLQHEQTIRSRSVDSSIFF